MLTLFLNIRLAFWVAAGIAVAFVGTLGTMAMLGLTMNVIAMFAFIIAVGVVVDDAVVVAESIHLERQKGLPGVVAAIVGARRIQKPLTFAVLTTTAAFLPLAFVPGPTASAFRFVPVVLGSILVLSLIESLFILPNHLSHLPGPGWRPTNPLERLAGSVQVRVDGVVQRAIDGPVLRALNAATRHPAIVVAGAGAVFILVMSLLPAGIARVHVTAPVEGEFATAKLEMAVGTPAAHTFEVVQQLEAAAHRAARALQADAGHETPLVTGVSLLVGMDARASYGSLAPPVTSTSSGHTGTVQARLLPPSRRPHVSGELFTSAWREEIGSVPGMKSLEISADMLERDPAVELNVWHDDPAQDDEAVQALLMRLEAVEGIVGLRSDRGTEMDEIEVELLPAARSLGISLEALAQQVRAAFFGVEAVRFQRGPEDVTVLVRLPPDERNSLGDLERISVRTPGGRTVPLRNVARLALAESPSSIRRLDAQRVTRVSADVDPAILTSGGAATLLAGTILPEMQTDFPGFRFRVGGQQQALEETGGSLGVGFLLALLAIYSLLVIPLRSLVRPFIIMVVIPFGIVGAVIGHLLLGLDLSTESFIGVVGPAGIVVNDSLVMLDAIDRRRDEGIALIEAVVEGARERFRPIFLTTITTLFGFLPTILDASAPLPVRNMAVTIGVGVFVATGILMLLVPAVVVLTTKDRSARASGVEAERPLEAVG